MKIYAIISPDNYLVEDAVYFFNKEDAENDANEYGDEAEVIEINVVE